jgi:hypothetical protein
VGGFFFDYRDAKFNEDAFMRAYKTILRIDFRGEEKISKKLVALIYPIPFFLICNEIGVVRLGGSKMLCEKAIADFNDLIGDKLGTV